MAKILSKSGISSLQIVRPWHVTQSIDAFTGTEAYDISLSGSFTTTGSITSTGNISSSGTVSMLTASIGGGIFTSASLAAGGGGGSTFPFTGDAQITGSLLVTGSNFISGTLHLMNPELTAPIIKANNESFLFYVGNNYYVGNTGGSLNFLGSSIIFNNGPITASVDISSSATIFANTASIAGVQYPTSDGTDGQVIVTDGAGNLSFGHGEKLYLQVRNDDSVDITAGTPIYSTGEIGGSERIKVRIASASDASKMPAIGIVETTLTTTGGTKDGFAIVNGTYNTSITPISGTPTLGDNIYVHADGGVTTNKPSGSNLIQNIGTVLKTNGTVIQGMKVSSIDRTNDVPNLLESQIFFGSGSNQAYQTHISGALDSTIINNITASGAISASGDLYGNRINAGGYVSTPLLTHASTPIEVNQHLSGSSTVTASFGHGSFHQATLTNTTLEDSLLITTTEDSSTAGPVVALKRNSSSPDDGDYLGQIKFLGENDNEQQVLYAKITGKISDASDTTEDGIIEYAVKKAGSNVIVSRLTSTDLKLINGTGLEVNGNISTDGTFTGDGSPLTNLQRPITSSTIHFTASNSNSGFYFRADGSVTCSIQPNSVVSCDIGNEFEIFQTSSAGYVLFATGSGVTLNSKSGNQKLTGQFSAATLKKIGTDEWDLIGDLG